MFLIDNGHNGCYNEWIIRGGISPFGQSGRRLAGKTVRRLRAPAGVLIFKKDKMMRSVSLCRVVLAAILGALTLLPFGCAMDQLGESAAEGHRRHRRVLRINRQELMADIDRALLLDKPSKLTDKRIP